MVVLRLNRWGQPRGDVLSGDGVFAVGRDVVFADVSGHGGPSRGQEAAIEPGAGVRDPGDQETWSPKRFGHSYCACPGMWQ